MIIAVTPEGRKMKIYRGHGAARTCVEIPTGWDRVHYSGVCKADDQFLNLCTCAWEKVQQEDIGIGAVHFAVLIRRV